MVKFKKIFLALVTVALGATSSGAMAIADVPIEVGGTIYNFNYVTGSYTALSSTYFNTTYMPWWGDKASAIDFATAIGVDLGYPNNSGSLGPSFAHNLIGSVVRGKAYSDVGLYTNDANVDTSNSYAIIMPASAAVPEIDGALIPQVGLLLAGLFIILGRRKENTEPMLAV